MVHKRKKVGILEKEGGLFPRILDDAKQTSRGQDSKTVEVLRALVKQIYISIPRLQPIILRIDIVNNSNKDYLILLISKMFRK